MVRLAHVSDTQLGKRPRNTRPGIIRQEIRAVEDDFYNVWKGFVDDVVDGRIKVDAILHSGDFFDTPCGYDPNPPPEYSRRVVAETLRSLDEAEIPLFVIDGNHGRYMEYRSSTLSEYTAIFPNFHAFTYYNLRDSIRDQKPLYKDVKSLNLRVLAHPFIESKTLDNLNLRPIYDAWVKVQNSSISDDSVNVALVHGMTLDGSLHPSILNADYDYVALGHDHRMHRVNDKAWCAGSMERWDISEVSQEKGYLLVEMERGSAYPRITPGRLNLPRPAYDLEIELHEGATSTTIINDVKAALDEKSLHVKYHYDTAARVRIRLIGPGLSRNIYNVSEAQAFLNRLVLSGDEYNVVEFLLTTEQLLKTEEAKIGEVVPDVEFLIEDPAAEFKAYLTKERKDALQKEGLDPDLLARIFAETLEGVKK
jgi:DNA repair exonuclease SbcCD nuclease subunit